MKRTVIALLTISICFCGDNLPAQLEQIKEALQKKYQVYSLEDLHKLKNPSQPAHRTASRDMEDLVGDWMMEEENMEILVTVGTDQSIPDPFTTLGLVEADGSVTATTNDFETDLNYLMIGLFGDDGPDCNMSCEGEYNDYMDYGIDVSDDYCECCHEDYPIDEICEDENDDDGDDWSPEAVITNMNLMEFFMLMFGFDPDSLGVENPVVVGSSSTQTESGDIVLDEVRAMVFSDGEMSELEADPEEAIAATIIDISTGAVTFNSLSLYDATGTAALTLSGTIGPGILDFVAGQETEFPFLEDLEDLFEEDDEDIFLYFYEDSTGTEIQAKYFEGDEYYDEGIYVDTSYFTWYATSDSLFLYEEYDDYYGEEGDTTELEYAINGDTLFMGASFDVCEGEPLEECLEFANEEIAGLEDLEDVESLRLSGEMVLMPGSYSSVDPGDGTPCPGGSQGHR